MNEDELVHGLINSLAFEVEAIPEDNFVKFTSTNGTPLNVKVRVRNKDEPRLVQRGIVSVPKLGKHIASLDQIRVISSDQTILSFNVYMETELENRSAPKSRKHGFNFFKFGGCLGTSYDEDEGPYLPGPSGKKAIRSRTSSKSDSNILIEIMTDAEKQKFNLESSNAATRDQKKLFGKCKPGGCLDPPFGEDREPYRPANAQSRAKQEHGVKVDNSKEKESISSPNVEKRKSSVEPEKFKKESPKDVIQSKPLLDIYARPVSIEHSSTSKYANSTAGDPSKISSSKIIDTGKKTSNTYDNNSQRESYQYQESYFVPPKDILQPKEEERKYSRERSNDRIRPASLQRENELQTSNIPLTIDASNKKYSENAESRSPTKLPIHKGKNNTEIIKQTLTDLTSIETNKQKTPENRKSSRTHLNIPVISQKDEINSNSQEIQLLDETNPINLNEFDIPIAPNDLNFSNRSHSSIKEAKNEDLRQSAALRKNEEDMQTSVEKKSGIRKYDEIKHLNKDNKDKNKNNLKNEEMKKSATNLKPLTMPELKSEQMKECFTSPTSIDGHDEVKTLRSVTSSDRQKDQQVHNFSPTSNDTSKSVPIKAGDKINQPDDSNLSANKEIDQEKLTMQQPLPSREKILLVDNTNERYDTTPEVFVNGNIDDKNRETYVSSETSKCDSMKRLPAREISQDETYKSQKLKESKQISENPNILANVDNVKEKESVKINPILNKQVDKSIRDKQVQDCINHKIDSDDDPQKHFNSIKENASSTSQDFDSKIIPNAKSNNSVTHSTGKNDKFKDVDGTKMHVDVIKDTTTKTLKDYSKIIQNEYFNNSTSRNDSVKSPVEILKHVNTQITSLNDDKQARTYGDLIANQDKMHSTLPSTIDKQILDEERKKKVPKSVTEASLEDILTSDNVNEPIVLKDVILDKNYYSSDLNEKANTKPNAETKVSQLKTYDKKQLQGNNDMKDILVDKEATNTKIVFDHDDKKNHTMTSTNDNSLPNIQPIDKSLDILETHTTRNLSHDANLNLNKDSRMSSTKKAESSNSLKTENLNYEENKKAPRNKSINDIDNITIRTDSQHDRNKELSTNTQDRIPSAILQKIPLLRTDDTDLRNDDINVIKPFKRNTFTIVTSSTSLEKQEEIILSKQTDRVIDTQIDDENDTNLELSENKFTDSQQSVQDNEQKYKGISINSKNGTTLKDQYKHISETNFQSHDQPTGSDIERESKNNIYELDFKLLPESKETGNTGTMMNSRTDDQIGTKKYEKSSSSPDKVFSDVHKEGTDLRSTLEDHDDGIYNQERLISKNTPSDSGKQILEFEDKSDFENINLESDNDETMKRKANMAYNISSDLIKDHKVDSNITQETYSPFKYNTDDLFDNKISISSISRTSEKAKFFSAIEPTKNTDYVAQKETISFTSNNKFETDSARAALEHGYKLLEMSENEFNNELAEPKITPSDIPHSTVMTGDFDQRYKKSTTDDENINNNEKIEVASVKSSNKVLDNSYYGTISDPFINNSENLKKSSDSGITGNYKEITKESNTLITKDDTRHSSEFGSRLDKFNDLRKISESDSIGSKGLHKTLITSEDSPDYDDSLKKNKNEDDVKTKMSKTGLVEVAEKESVLRKDEITRSIVPDDVIKVLEHGALENLSGSDAADSFRKDNNEKLPMHEDNVRYNKKTSQLSKTPISTTNFENIDESGTEMYEENIIEKRLNKQTDAVILMQQDDIRKKSANQNENVSAEAKIGETMSHNQIQKTQSEIIYLNLALQSYVKDNDDIVVQTLNPFEDPVRYKDDNITIIQSLIRHGQEIRIPVDLTNDLGLKFMKNTQKVPQELNAKQHKIRITKNISDHSHYHPKALDESLALIYEKELIPLHNIIKNLTEEINTLTTQQDLLKDKLRGAKRTKSLRLIPVSKRCGCGRM